MTDEMEGIWKEAAVLMKILPWHLLGGPVEDHEKYMS
jgi:hypothetical protein